MTSVRVSLVDLYVLRGAASLECLVLRRGANGRRPGSWKRCTDTSSRADAARAARREPAEETGLARAALT